MIQWGALNLACENCSRGHRSWSCAHLDRLLREVPPPGRPKSQCLNCRAKRERVRAHHNCRCGPEPPSDFRDYLSLAFRNSPELRFEFPKASLPVETLLTPRDGSCSEPSTQPQDPSWRSLEALQEHFSRNPDLKVFLVRKAKDIQVPITLQVAQLELKRLPLTTDELQKQSGMSLVCLCFVSSPEI